MPGGLLAGSLGSKIKEWFTRSENWLVDLFDVDDASRDVYCGRAFGPKTVKIPPGDGVGQGSPSAFLRKNHFLDVLPGAR